VILAGNKLLVEKEFFYQISVNQRRCRMDEYIIQSSIRSH